MFLTNKSTIGDANNNGRRVYVCATGKYNKPYGTLDCCWKITLKKKIGQLFWYMETVTPGKCTYIHTCTSIDVITLINLLDFHLQIKKLNGNKSMTMKTEQLQQQIAKKHCIQFMTAANFGNAQRAVVVIDIDCGHLIGKKTKT